MEDYIDYIDYIPGLGASIETAVLIGIFKSKHASIDAHLYHSHFEKVPLRLFHKQGVHNFNSDRLQVTRSLAYPSHNRPRSKKDLLSVKYAIHKMMLPIWMYYDGKTYTLLDGAHRVVAAYIKRYKHINAYVIHK